MGFDSAFNSVFSALKAKERMGEAACYTEKAYPHPSSKSVTIYGTYDNLYDEVNSVESGQPVFTCFAEDVPHVLHGDKITRDNINYAVSGIQPAGTSEVTLVLEVI